MNNLMVFENHSVEVFEFNGRVLFNPYHVGECLDMKPDAVRYNMSKMNDKQVVKLKNSDVSLTHISVESTIRALNPRGENFLTESGVYKLIFKSRKKEAEKFADWVTDEVLPSIRKTGKYEMDKQEKELKTFQGVPVMTVGDLVNLTGISRSTVQFHTKKVDTGRKVLSGADVRQFKRENNISDLVSCLAVLDCHGVKQALELLGVPNMYEPLRDKFKTGSVNLYPTPSQSEMSDAQRADLLLRTIPYLDKKASQELAKQLVGMLLG